MPQNSRRDRRAMELDILVIVIKLCDNSVDEVEIRIDGDRFDLLLSLSIFFLKKNYIKHITQLLCAPHRSSI